MRLPGAPAFPRVAYNEACALGAAYVASPDHARRHVWLLAAVNGLAVAGMTATLRKQMRRDPFLTAVVESPAFRTLERAWLTSPDAAAADYEALSCFGGLTPALVARGYAWREALSAALAEAAAVTSWAPTDLSVDDSVLRAWSGALSWQRWGIDAGWINAVQRAGYLDRQALLRHSASALPPQVAAWCRVAETDPLTAATPRLMGAANEGRRWPCSVLEGVES
jgi:hypothetical protein